MKGCPNGRITRLGSSAQHYSCFLGAKGSPKAQQIPVIAAFTRDVSQKEQILTFHLGWHFYFTLAHTHLQPDDPVEALKGNSKLKVIDLQIIYLGKEGYKSAIKWTDRRCTPIRRSE